MFKVRVYNVNYFHLKIGQDASLSVHVQHQECRAARSTRKADSQLHGQRKGTRDEGIGTLIGGLHCEAGKFHCRKISQLNLPKDISD